MNIKDLVEVAQSKILNQTGDLVSKQKLTIGFNAIFEAIKAVSSVENVTIYNFGTFSRKQIKKQQITTKFTKHLPSESVTVEAHIAPKFKPSKQYKAMLRYGQS